jgi:DNA anti-recombination protein RmuC
MASLTEQLNATSVKIEANYLKKKLNEEQQRQQQLEKDYEYAQINFAKQQAEMEQDIAQLSAEIKDKKSQVEENMMSECRNYSNKVWGEINKALQAQQEPILKDKEEKARILQEEIDKMTLLVADQDADIKAKQEYIAKLEQDIKVRIEEIEAINNVRDYFNTPEFRQRVSDKKKKRKFEEFKQTVKKNKEGAVK